MDAREVVERKMQMRPGMCMCMRQMAKGITRRIARLRQRVKNRGGRVQSSGEFKGERESQCQDWAASLLNRLSGTRV